MRIEVSETETQEERLRGFLSGLAVLRDRWNMQVGGCGECGSAWVEDISSGETVGQEIEWDDKAGGWRFGQGSILDPEMFWP